MRRQVLRLVALLVAGFSVASGFISEPGRLGCYEDNHNDENGWQQWLNLHEQNTVNFCRNMCQDFKYAGVSFLMMCMCGDDLPPRMLHDSRCDLPCPGKKSESCGGQLTLDVYSVEPKPVLIGKPMGCFQDGQYNHVWKTGLIWLQTNSLQRCLNSCRGFRYAGLMSGDRCMCGNALPPTPLPRSSCQMPCSGNPGKKCGGNWTLDVFQISEMQGPVRVIGRVPSYYQQRGALGKYKLFTQRKTWEDALQQCEDDDAHLLIINSEEEAQFVRSLFAQVPSERRMHAGFSDLLRRGTYRTISGKLLESTGYNLWSSHHPKVASSVKHCGSLDVHARLAQIDGNCEAQAVFVCEKNLDSQEDDGQPFNIDFRNVLG